MDEEHVLQKRLSPFIVSDIFHTITDEDILKVVDGKWTHKGKILLPATIALLKKEAIAFSKTGLFSILVAEFQYHARDFQDKAQSENAVISARLISYLADVLKTEIKKIAEMKPE